MAGWTASRGSNWALDFADLPVEDGHVIFAIIAPFAPLAFVAGQGVVILLIDLSIAADGLKVVPP
jgi:hypothetical protein